VNPETQTVSHSFPKLCAALQRKFGTDAAYPPRRRYVFGFVGRERITTNGTLLGSSPAMRRRLPNREVAGLFVSQRIATRRTLAAMPKSVAKESFIVLKVRLAGELDRPVAGLGRRASRSSQRVPLQQAMYIGIFGL
jgi:hypothetical protein